jgi:hypothetical protein
MHPESPLPRHPHFPLQSQLPFSEQHLRFEPICAPHHTDPFLEHIRPPALNLRSHQVTLQPHPLTSLPSLIPQLMSAQNPSLALLISPPLFSPTFASLVCVLGTSPLICFELYMVYNGWGWDSVDMGHVLCGARGVGETVGKLRSLRVDRMVWIRTCLSLPILWGLQEFHMPAPFSLSPHNQSHPDRRCMSPLALFDINTYLFNYQCSYSHITKNSPQNLSTPCEKIDTFHIHL